MNTKKIALSGLLALASAQAGEIQPWYASKTAIATGAIVGMGSLVYSAWYFGVEKPYVRKVQAKFLTEEIIIDNEAKIGRNLTSYRDRLRAEYDKLITIECITQEGQEKERRTKLQACPHAQEIMTELGALNSRIWWWNEISRTEWIKKSRELQCQRRTQAAKNIFPLENHIAIPPVTLKPSSFQDYVNQSQERVKLAHEAYLKTIEPVPNPLARAIVSADASAFDSSEDDCPEDFRNEDFITFESLSRRRLLTI